MRVLLTLLVGACASLPGAPDVDLCLIDYPRDQLICKGTIDTDREFDVYLEDADKYVCVSPEHWEEIKNYVGDLKDELEDCGILR